MEIETVHPPGSEAETVVEPVETLGWPAGLLELAEEIGAPACLALVDRFPGVEVYVPTTEQLPRDHHLVRALGWETAVALTAARGGEHFAVPTLFYARCKKSRIIKATGTNRAIALKFGVTESYVRRLRAGLVEDKQFALQLE